MSFDLILCHFSGLVSKLLGPKGEGRPREVHCSAKAISVISGLNVISLMLNLLLTGVRFNDTKDRQNTGQNESKETKPAVLTKPL